MSIRNASVSLPGGPESQPMQELYVTGLLTVGHQMMDDAQLETKARLLLSLRLAKQALFENLLRDSNGAENSIVQFDENRDRVYLLCELFYAFHAMQVDTPELLEEFLRAHTRRLEKMIANRFPDRATIAKKAATKKDEPAFKRIKELEKLKNGCFSSEGIAVLTENFKAAGRLELHLKSIGKLLCEIASRDSFSKEVHLLVTLGLLEGRINAANGALMVSSNGRIEWAFGEYLNEIRTAALL